LVTKNGYLLDPPVTIGSGQTFSYIDESGRIWVKVTGYDSLSPIGQMTLATFIHPEGLKALEAPLNHIYMETVDSGQPIIGPPQLQGAGFIIGSALEDFSVKQETVPDRGCNKEIENLKDKANVQKTDKVTDLAIDGKGFFKVLDPVNNQSYYTRYGSFSFNGTIFNGIHHNLSEAYPLSLYLATKHGYIVDPPIIPPADKQKISRIDDEGRIWVKTENSDKETQMVQNSNNGTEPVQLNIILFKNPAALKPAGFSRGSLYMATKESGEEIISKPKQNGAGIIVSGSLENCTTDLIALPQE
jgi:flagellar hook protein FlgE